MEMDDFTMQKTKPYSASTSTVAPLLTRPKGIKSLSPPKAFDSFRSGPDHAFAPALGENGRQYNAKAAAWNTANTPLVRRLKGRHLQMIAIGGSIGTYLPISREKSI
jgi:amino acid transporter